MSVTPDEWAVQDAEKNEISEGCISGSKNATFDTHLLSFTGGHSTKYSFLICCFSLFATCRAHHSPTEFTILSHSI